MKTPTRSVALNSTVGVATSIGSSILGFLAGIVVARDLGPAGRGQFGFVAGMVTILVMLAGLGVPTALSHAKAKLGFTIDDLYGSAVVVTVLIGSVITAAFAVIFWVLRRSVFSGVGNAEAVWVMVLLVPLLLLNNWTSIAYLEDRIVEFNLVGVGGSAVYLLAAGVASVLGWLTPLATVAIWGLCSLVPLAAVVRRYRFRGRDLKHKALRVLRYGASTNLATWALILGWRADVVIVKYDRGFSELGLYVVAVSLAEILLQLGVSARIALTPRQGSAKGRDDLVDLICQVNRVVALALVMVATGLALLAIPMIGVLYGTRFAGSVPALLWLLPGAIALVLQGPLIDYLLVEGAVASLTTGVVLALIVNLTVNIALLPHLTFVIAAIASTTSYWLSLVWCVVLFSRRTGKGVLAIVRPTRGDAHLVRGLLHRMFGSLRNLGSPVP